MSIRNDHRTGTVTIQVQSFFLGNADLAAFLLVIGEVFDPRCKVIVLVYWDSIMQKI